MPPRFHALLVCLCALSCAPSPGAGANELIWVTALGKPVLDPLGSDNRDASLLAGLVFRSVRELCPEADVCRAPCTFACTPSGTLHDGRPITLETVRESLERCAGDGAVLGPRPGTITFEGQAPAGLGSCKIAGWREGGTWVGSGAYRAVTAGEDPLVLEAIDASRLPLRIRVESVGDHTTVIGRFLSGRADFAVGLPEAHVHLLEAAGVVGDARRSSGVQVVLLFRASHPALADPEVRRCLAGLLAPTLGRWQARVGLVAPRLPIEPQVDPETCRQRLRAVLPDPLVVETVDLPMLRLPTEAALEALSQVARIEPVPVPEDDTSPLAEPMRLTSINLDHPAGLALFLRSQASYNLGAHADPELDRLLDAGAGPEALAARLAASPPFVAVGTLSHGAVTSRRFRLIAEGPAEDATLHFAPARD